MTLTHILVFSLFALLVGWVAPPRTRGPLLLGGSVLALYWLQPSTPVRNLDFWFPTASLGLVVLVWAVTRTPLAGSAEANRRTAWLNIGIVVGVILAIGLTRYLEPICCLTPSRPPDLLRIAAAVAIGSVAAAIPARLLPGNRLLPTATILFLLGLFIVLKTEYLARAASGLLRTASGQTAGLASALDLPWLGFSYLAFRLLHTLRDHQAGKLPAYSLGEFTTYAIFFPAYTAGPIDRIQRFSGDLRKTMDSTAAVAGADRIAGGWRIVVGVFKKFVLADSLALVALNTQSAGQVQSTQWMWVLLYAYSLRIYLDFSGYTDIALGLGRLVGLRLPENFDRPYLRQNLTAFWNSWHMTLANWFRAYFFNPVTRALRSGGRRPPAWMVIVVGQFGTMVLIGLWHGVTWNFAVWGAWHGLGLFVHNRWLDWSRSRLGGLAAYPHGQKVLQAGAWLFTFHYVTLGWVWFALPNPALAFALLRTLFGNG